MYNIHYDVLLISFDVEYNIVQNRKCGFGCIFVQCMPLKNHPNIFF